jgi:hypothetical protein
VLEAAKNMRRSHGC